MIALFYCISVAILLSCKPKPRLRVCACVCAASAAVSILLGTIATRIVSERSEGVRHSLSLMGLRTEAYWIASLLWFGLIGLLASLAFTGAQFLNRFAIYSDYGLLFLLNFAYMLSAVAFTCALCQTLSAPERAASVVGMMPIVVLVVWAAVGILADTAAPLKIVLSFAVPHLAYMVAMAEALNLEAQLRGVTIDSFASGSGAEGGVAPAVALGKRHAQDGRAVVLLFKALMPTAAG